MNFSKSAIKERKVKMISIALLILTVFIAALGQILLKKGMITVGVISQDITLFKYFFKAFTNVYIITGMILYFLGTFIWLAVLARVPLSIAYPCLALGYVFVALASKAFFNEEIAMIRWVGIIVICLGVFLISRSV
ncbi:MAG: EamA family transporter [Candidatus Omnitrophica bacterium]|nr:EamA family transporter [Candidatus Omnitrophota bacterium]